VTQFEIAARATVRADTIDYPNTKAGQVRAAAYVEAHWRERWPAIVAGYADFMRRQGESK
jgi:hypothetical protein